MNFSRRIQVPILNWKRIAAWVISYVVVTLLFAPLVNRLHINWDEVTAVVSFALLLLGIFTFLIIESEKLRKHFIIESTQQAEGDSSTTKSREAGRTFEPPTPAEVKMGHALEKAKASVNLFELADRYEVFPNKAVQSLAKARGGEPKAIGGLLFIWWDTSNDWKGLEPHEVHVSAARGKETSLEDWKNGLDQLPLEITKCVKAFMGKPPVSEIPESSNKDKVWLQKLTPPLTDRPGLILEVGRSDFRTTLAVGEAYTQQIQYKGTKTTLSQVYESGQLNWQTDLFGNVAAFVVMLTKDNYIVLAQRHRSLAYARSCYSVSCEEGWDPAKESNPYDTVLRCLSEEFALDAAHGVDVRPRNIRLVAIGREWGLYWNTALIYVVDLPCTADVVVENWDSAEDRDEHCGVCAMPVEDSEQRMLLIEAIRSGEIAVEAFKNVKKAGNPVNGKLHETTAAARILIALAHRFGVGRIAPD